MNRDYLAVVVKLTAEATGDTPTGVHESLGNRFLTDHDGNRRSTAELSTAEFSEYAERCLQLAAEYGIIVPPPGLVAR